MSDFDQEAEREKLRKKFARDEEKRAHTQRMSELLLKGATMTNKHCDQCSDPLFRYNGQTFCPSCQADGQADSPPQPEPEADAAASSETSTQTNSHTDAESTQPRAEPPHEPTADPREQVETQPTRDRSGASTVDQSAVETASPTPQPPTTDEAGLATARQSLERTVTRFAQRAEATEDPRRSRELLAAAREAAATLSELE